MEENAFLGILLHSIGGLAAASFYIPYKKVKGWSWEVYWIVGGFFSWIIAPWVMSLSILPDTLDILRSAPADALLWTWMFGMLWGVGGLMFGMTMRYLGIALGYAIVLGLCAIFGTLIPPLFSGELFDIAMTRSGQVILLGVLFCVIGIAFSGMAGIQKEKDLGDTGDADSKGEFNFKKGLLVAFVSGLLSACMSFAFASGKPIAEIALECGAPTLWQNLPVLIVVMFGGFTTNFVWCLFLAVRKGTFKEFFSRTVVVSAEDTKEEHIETATDAPGEEMAEHIPGLDQSSPSQVPLIGNYLLCMIAGITWYLQFFFYSMGSTKLGKALEFSSWTLHMSTIIIFSTIWGLLLKEWKGSGSKTRMWIALGFIALVLSTIIIGLGNKIGAGGAVGH